MGFYLLHESMIFSVLDARDRFLKPDGIMLPQTCHVFCAPVDLEGFHQEHVEFWGNVFGFDMSPIKPLIHPLAASAPDQTVMTVRFLVF